MSNGKRKVDQSLGSKQKLW